LIRTYEKRVSGMNESFGRVFDEFIEEKEYDEGEQPSSARALLPLLDGQECRLDAKYEKTLIKRAKVPRILMGKLLPKSFIKKERGTRIMPLAFDSPHCEDLQEDRIAATMYGCMCRRAAYYSWRQGLGPIQNETITPSKL